MIILLIIISIIALVVACITGKKEIVEFFEVCIVVLLVIGILLGTSVSNGRTIDEKIAMYQEENNKIEKQIDTLVSNYTNYESDTYEKIKSESPIKLVEEQISVYETNNIKIRILKENKINLKVEKWWLYFGG